jgi:hypothetical protein
MVYFLLYHTIHDVLKTEKILKSRGAAFELVPVPRNLSSDCGSCVKLHGTLEDTLPHIAHIEIDRLIAYDGEAFKQMDNPWKT